MNYKRFVLCFLGFFCTITLGNALLNIILDPYEIFEHQLLGDGTYHNQRYEKINFLKDNHQRFNAYLIGSSRIGFITPQKIESYLPESRFYNAWVSSGNPLDAQIFIDWLLKNRYEVKYLFIQIGTDHAIDILDHRIATDMQRNWHYEINAGNPIDFYAPYVFGFLAKAISQKSKILLKGGEIPQFEDIQSGVWGYTIRERERHKDLEAYIANEPSFHKPQSKPRDYMPLVQFALLKETLIKLDEQCKTNQIQCVFMTAPMYYKDAWRYSQDLRDSILELLAQHLSDGFWHFDYLNSITTDEHNYYESTHQVPEIDTMMLAKIFGDNTKAQEDFGIFITKHNLTQSIERIRQIEQKFQKVDPHTSAQNPHLSTNRINE